MNGPIVNGRASICHWNLEFRFFDKEQCSKFMRKWMEMEVTGSFSIKYEKFSGEGAGAEEHWITIEDGYWSHNLVKIAQLLESVDYTDKFSEEQSKVSDGK
jgi:hypothetical protein